MRYFILIFTVLFSSYLQAQRLSSDWHNKAAQQVNEYKSCKSNSANSECIQQIGKSLYALYRLNDFYFSDKNKYMSVSEIYDNLQQNKRWKLLGRGYEQPVLEQAQKLANNKRAVIAIYLSQEKIRQLAYIMPGELIPSGSWRMKVPNSFALISSNPEKSYYDKGLSYSFPRRIITEVLIYTREI